MLTRWIALFLLAFSIALATPIAVSSLPDVALHISTRPATWTFDGGLLTRFAFRDPGGVPPPTNLGNFEPKPWLCGIARNRHHTFVYLPIWPLPLAIGSLGYWLLRRWSLEYRLNAVCHIFSGDRRARRSRRLTTILQVVSIAFTMLIVLSFVCDNGVEHWTFPAENAWWSHHFGVRNGSLHFLKLNMRPSFLRYAEPALFKIIWVQNNSLTHRAVPVWPLLALLLPWTVVRTIRHERSFLALLANRCPRCNYPRPTVSTPVCPECGSDLPPLSSSIHADDSGPAETS
jgi:hypothetical protein